MWSAVSHRILSAVDTDCVVRFEKIVQKLNEAVAAFVAQEPSPIAWNRVNLYVIEFSDHFMCLTGIGRMCSLFLQKQKDGQMRAFDGIEHAWKALGLYAHHLHAGFE